MGAVTKVGPEFVVNTTAEGNQAGASVSSLSGGGYIITWTSYDLVGNSEINAQIYAADGSLVGSEFVVNTTTASDQSGAVVAGLTDGGFVVTWITAPDAINQQSIYAQQFDAAGNPVGAEKVLGLSTTVAYTQNSVTGLSNGGYVISWTTQDFDATGRPIDSFAQIYDATGNAVGGPIQLPDDPNYAELSPRIIAGENGSFLAVWESSYASFITLAQAYDASGSPIGAAVTIGGRNTQITALENGGYVAVQDLGGNGTGVVILDSSLNTLDSFFAPATRPNNGTTAPQVVAMKDGGFVIVTQEPDNGGGLYADIGIFAQRFDANGVAIGNKILVNTTTMDTQLKPVVDVLEDGAFVVSWEGIVTDTAFSYEVYGQLFDAQLFGTHGAETMTDSFGADWMRGQGGDDTLYGLAGDDLIHGGAGNDTLYGGEGSDRLKGNIGNDTLYGGAGNDFLKGQAGDDTLVGGAGKDALRGGAGADTFVFNAIEDSTLSLNDRIMDFEQGIDLIDMSAIGGLSFIGSDGFSGIGGEIRAYGINGNTILKIDVDGDGMADMKVFIAGSFTMADTDFIL